MKKWEFNDDIPAEEAAAMVRAAERYANVVEKPDVRVIFAILGIERVGVIDCVEQREDA